MEAIISYLLSVLLFFELKLANSLTLIMQILSHYLHKYVVSI